MRFIEPDEKVAVLLTALKNFNFSMHLNVYKQIWLKFGMMIDAWFYSTRPFLDSKVTWEQESANFCTNYLTKFFIDFDGIG